MTTPTDEQIEALVEQGREPQRFPGGSRYLKNLSRLLANALQSLQEARKVDRAALAAIEEDGTEEHNAAVALRSELVNERAQRKIVAKLMVQRGHESARQRARADAAEKENERLRITLNKIVEGGVYNESETREDCRHLAKSALAPAPEQEETPERCSVCNAADPLKVVTDNGYRNCDQCGRVTCPYAEAAPPEQTETALEKAPSPAPEMLGEIISEGYLEAAPPDTADPVVTEVTVAEWLRAGNLQAVPADHVALPRDVVERSRLRAANDVRLLKNASSPVLEKDLEVAEHDVVTIRQALGEAE